MKLACLLLLAAAPASLCQIHADFTVSHGDTPLGTFRARLDHDKAPRTCANFIGLATGRRPWIDVTTGGIRENSPYYDGLTFHRLIHDFVIQGGSPNGQGTDGPGYAILDEYHADLRHSGRYFLSMAKSSLPNTGGSQFFITLAATPHLDDKHSIFGEVILGREIIDGFTDSAAFPTGAGNRPVTPIVIDSVTLSGPDYASFDPDDPALKLPVIGGMKLQPSRNAEASTFTTGFDRRAGHEYFNSYSFNLQSWTPFRYSLSCDDEEGETFVTSGVDFPRFFMRMIDIDYSFLNNAPASLNENGRKLRITSRGGDWVELTFSGGGTGTWTASNSTSGSLSGVIWTDSAPASGFFPAPSAQVQYLPLGTLRATFNGPAGAGSWTSLNSLILSFHSPASGWVEGVATTPSGNVAVNQSFTVNP